MQGNQEFHSKFRTERLKRNVVDNYFKTIKRKLNRPGQNAIVFYRVGTFPSRGPGGREGVLTGSLKQACKRHFLSRSANEHRLPRSCVFCKQEDVTKTEDHAYCQHCESVCGKERYVHRDKLGAQNIQRSDISDAKG